MAGLAAWDECGGRVQYVPYGSLNPGMVEGGGLRAYRDWWLVIWRQISDLSLFFLNSHRRFCIVTAVRSNDRKLVRVSAKFPGEQH